MRHQRSAGPTKLPAGGFRNGRKTYCPRAGLFLRRAEFIPLFTERIEIRSTTKLPAGSTTSAFGSSPLTPSLSPEYLAEGAVFRPGFTLIETIVALVVLAAAMLAVVQTVAVVSRQRQLTERRALAVQEVANVMERVYGLPWSELTQERAAEDTLSPACRQRLPAATLQVTVQAVGDPQNEKRILVEIDWQGADGGRSRPVRLTAWRFRSQEARP